MIKNRMQTCTYSLLITDDPKVKKTTQNMAVYFKPLKILFKEGPLTKNGPIDFAQSWAIHMKKSN
jgi:hypothetical protein